MEETDDTTAAMAQAMGFSSFGAQTNPNKRRKFNPRADAVVASTTTSIPLRRNSEAKSGSNAIPLGVRVRNNDEINLEDDEVGAAESPVHNDPKEGSDSEPGPQYLDTSRPPDIVAVSPTDNTMSTTKIDTMTRDYPGHVVGGQSSELSTGGGPASRGNGRGNYQSRQSQGHEPGKKWWGDYYDPSSNVNPWERLEQTKGLGPRGSWMSWEEAKR
ncbi:hypothetical protein F5Y11DRAFT_204096 [Daldinia sp. FL1419]|nr:hypothetical protein F5Y11DRAFT_204096 [Daldinia sp. FL1419]